MDEPNWSHSNSDVLVWQLPGEETPVVPTKKKSLIRPAAGAAIVLSALVTGTVFGVTMIRAVSIPDEKPAGVIVSEAPGQTEEQIKPINVPVFVIQGGLFSTKEAAMKAAKSTETETAVIPLSNQYSVIYGAFLSREDAKKEARQIEEKGMPVYVKSIAISMEEKEKKAFTDEADSKKRIQQLKRIMLP